MNNKSHGNHILATIFQGLWYILKTVLTILPKALNRLITAIEKRLRFSITFKTTTMYALIFSSTMFVLSTILIGSFAFFLIYETKNGLDKSSKIIGSYFIESGSINESNLRKYAETENIAISIFDNKKNLYFSSAKIDNTYFPGELNNKPIKQLNNISLSYINNTMFILYNSELTLNSQKYPMVLTKDLAIIINYVVILALILLGSCSFLLLVMISIGSRTSKKMLRPIYAMTNTAKSISVKALDTRLDVVDSHDELKDLAETFNGMLDRLQESYELQNRFVSDASHELRTPISVIQGYANLLNRWGKEDKEVLDESVTAIRNEAENMKELVEKLLFLARTDKNTQKIEREIFPVNGLIDEIIKETRMIDEHHTIANNKNDIIYINADRKLVKQALRIFIDNSIKYTPVGGTIKINSFVQKKMLNIVIEDSGMGISKEDLPHIFDRFYRCDKARTRQSGGTGLGLSIAKWIIGKHKGSIEVESALNKGTKIIINLPI
jgi:two-component system, OmpR family, sensor histidine kinase ArlS